MNRAIIRSKWPVTVLGAGEILPAVLEEALAHAPTLVAADGGAARALALGHDIDAVIGDLDSLDDEARARIPAERIHRIAEQETTDFDKCLRSISAPIVLAVGVTGARLDHELAAFATLVSHPRRRCLIVGPADVAFLSPRSLRLELEPGTRVSLFPMAPVHGTSRGLRWPIDGLRFSPAGRIGTSNEAAAPRVELTFTSRRMLVLLPRACLGAALTALGAEPAVTPDAPGG